MDFSLPPEAEQLREELRAWLRAHLTEDVVAAGRRGVTDDGAWPLLRDWNRTLADAGWAAISWPKEYGGRGATVLEQLVHAEETTRARAPLPINVIGINNIAPALMTYGTDEQRRTLLPRMVRADDVWCQGMSEPEAGSDLASLRTRAVRDGDDFVVTGQKVWTSLGHRADWCQLFVRTDPDAPKHRGISCLIVDMRLPGIEARPLATLNGATDFAEVFFDQVRVPADALLGPLHGGWQVATTTLSHERAGAARLYTEMQLRLEDLVTDLAAARSDSRSLVASAAPGRAPHGAEAGGRPALDDRSTPVEAGDRAGGGRPGLDDPVTLQRLGELALRTEYLELLCLRSASADVHGGDALASASLAKTVWAELGQDIAAVAFDLLGPGAAGGRWADLRLTSRSLTIAGGTTQVNKNVTARRVLGLPRT